MKRHNQLSVSLVLALCLLSAPPCDASENIAVKTAKDVIAAFEKGDEAAIKACAARPVDHWRVADAIVALDAVPAARKYQSYVRRPDAAALGRYLKDPPKVDPAVRRELRRVRMAVVPVSRSLALAALERLRVPSDSIVGAEIRFLRGYLLHRLWRADPDVARSADVLAALQAAARGAHSLGWLGMENATLPLLHNHAEKTGSHVVLISTLRRRAVVERLLGRETESAEREMDLGGILTQSGRPGEALPHLLRAHQVFGGAKHRAERALVAANISFVYARMGALARASDWLDAARSALGDRKSGGGYLQYLTMLGKVRMELGDLPGAIAALKGLLSTMATAGGTELDRAIAVGELAHAHHLAGNHTEAAARLDESMRIYRSLSDARGIADSLRLLGDVKAGQKDWKGAIASYKASLSEHGTPSYDDALSWLGLGEAQLDMGDPGAALDTLARAWQEARGIDARDLTSRARHAQARAYRALRRPREAHRLAMEALADLDRVVAGLSDEPMARVRAGRAEIFATGLRAALDAKEPDLAAAILEKWRARALLDAYGGRARLAGAGLPKDLAEEETRVIERLSAAHLAYRKARRRGKLSGTRAARDDLRAAQDALLAVNRRIQRVAKRVAGVTRSQPLDLATLRSKLTEGGIDVFIEYAVLADEVFALVVSGKDAKVLPVGTTNAVTDVCAALALDADNKEPQTAADGRIKAVRTAVLEPLGRDLSAKRVIVCPDGPLCYLPWPALLPDSEVACAPSGTAYALFLADRKLQGTAVLALGDPEYAQQAAGRKLNVYFHGSKLQRLPNSAVEVNAIVRKGDVKLLSKEATETNLRTKLADREHWRALHIASHGLVEERSPLLSALALTPDGSNDGFLSALEIFGMDIPADLVVLSACDTGRGRHREGEGVIGLTRAFAVAGAPRVIVSMWKVPDPATRALMTEFYKLWRPADGSKGLSTSAALRKAQAAVKSNKQWEHPFHWAAWVLWGLPD